MTKQFDQRNCECGNKTFEIKSKVSCDDCIYNAAFNEKTGLYETEDHVINELELERDQVEEEGLCDLGDAHGTGCDLYICTSCRKIQHNSTMGDQ